MELIFTVDPKRDGVVAPLPAYTSGGCKVQYGNMLFVPVSGFGNMQHFPLMSGSNHLPGYHDLNCWKAKLIEYHGSMTFVYRSGGG